MRIRACSEGEQFSSSSLPSPAASQRARAKRCSTSRSAPGKKERSTSPCGCARLQVSCTTSTAHMLIQSIRTIGRITVDRHHGFNAGCVRIQTEHAGKQIRRRWLVAVSMLLRATQAYQHVARLLRCRLSYSMIQLARACQCVVRIAQSSYTSGAAARSFSASSSPLKAAPVATPERQHVTASPCSCAEVVCIWWPIDTGQVVGVLAEAS